MPKAQNSLSAIHSLVSGRLSVATKVNFCWLTRLSKLRYHFLIVPEKKMTKAAKAALHINIILKQLEWIAKIVMLILEVVKYAQYFR